MAQTFFVTTTVPSIPVVQRAYQVYCIPTSEAVAEIESDWWSVRPLDVPAPVRVLGTDPPVEDWLKFQSLVAQWRNERGAMSSITEAVLCPAYQAIIGMGDTATRLLLAQLQLEADEPDQWFWALKAITGADPVDDKDRGDFVAMAKSWLDWAKSERYAW